MPRPICSALLTKEERAYLIQLITDLEGIGAQLGVFLGTAKCLLRAVPGLRKTAETYIYLLALELWTLYRGVNVTKH